MPLESTGTTDFDEAAFPDAIRFWMKVKDAEPPKPVRIIVTAGALEEIDLALDQYGRVEIFKKHRVSIEAAASDKFDKNRLEDETYEGMPVVRVSSDDLLVREPRRVRASKLKSWSGAGQFGSSFTISLPARFGVPRGRA